MGSGGHLRAAINLIVGDEPSYVPTSIKAISLSLEEKLCSEYNQDKGRLFPHL